MEQEGLIVPDWCSIGSPLELMWSYCGTTVELGWAVLGAKKAVLRLGNGLGFIGDTVDIQWTHCGDTAGLS